MSGRRTLRTAAAVVAAAVPARPRRWLHTRVLGYRLGAGATIGRSVVDVDHLELGPGATIGHLNVIRGCERVELGAGASIGFLVWVNSVRRSRAYFAGRPRQLRLTLGAGAALTCLHVVDCCDAVDIGAYSTVAGYGSQLLTHSIDIGAGRQTTAPVTIGERVFVGTGTVVLPGSAVADRSVVGAGAVVTGVLGRRHTLYAGNPAVPKRDLDPRSAYFTRHEAHVR